MSENATLDQRAFQQNAIAIRKARMEAEVAVRFILNDILTDVVAQGAPTTSKVDRRSSNKGAQRRTARSLKFKQNCIRDYKFKHVRITISRKTLRSVAVPLHAMVALTEKFTCRV